MGLNTKPLDLLENVRLSHRSYMIDRWSGGWWIGGTSSRKDINCQNIYTSMKLTARVTMLNSMKNNRAKSMCKDVLNVSCLWKSEIHISCSNNILNFKGKYFQDSLRLDWSNITGYEELYRNKLFSIGLMRISKESDQIKILVERKRTHSVWTWCWTIAKRVFFASRPVSLYSSPTLKRYKGLRT